jgi:beta-glucosidase
MKDAETRARELLAGMTTEEKIRQVTAEMIFDVGDEYEQKRDPLCGSYRNPGHFMHRGRKTPAKADEVARRINRDVEISIAAQPHGIPPIENGEALHGAQWGMGTAFPQPIAMASSFDPAMVEEIGRVIGQECAAVGVRQVFSPVVNVTRDCRWGRTVETYGEDVRLSCDMGAAMCRGLEREGVIATPKHFADNYGAGGRDSNYSETSERTMREVFLPPFKACFDAGAQSVMAAYNAWEGVPCSGNYRLLTEILREEWGFEGFVVSDYSGVDGMATGHRYCADYPEAAAAALKAGLDVILPYRSYDQVKEAMDRGLMTEEELDKNVLRILTAKFRLGLFDDPYADPDAATALVRCEAHKTLALRAARESIVLLKNNGVLPLNKAKLRRVGVFGESAGLIPVGSNYSGPYQFPWTGEDAPTPLEALRAYLGDGVELVTAQGDDIPRAAANCDVNLYYTSLVEGEGADRSDLRLPSVTVHRNRDADGGLIVDAAEQTVREDQEKAILAMCEANPASVVVLLNGAPVDMTAWESAAASIVEAWYPGEQGAKALTEILFGEVNPSAKLPISFPKHVGQLPLFYAYKPSGRGYAYCDNDGKPLYPFGYGLSYTSFQIAEVTAEVKPDAVTVSFTVENTGDRAGTEVVQLYDSSRCCRVVRPIKELKAYCRVTLAPGEKKRAALTLKADDFRYYDEAMRFGLWDGIHTLIVGNSCEDEAGEVTVTVRDGRLCPMSTTKG